MRFVSESCWLKKYLWGITVVGVLLGASAARADWSEVGTPIARADWSEMGTPIARADWSEMGTPIELNKYLCLPEAESLVFSDHPERVCADGLLCQGGLRPLHPVRLQFYHQGGRDTPLYLVLRLRNRGKIRANLTAVGGFGLGTEEDYFRAGHGNNVEFFANWAQGRGRLLSVAPGESYTVWYQQLPRDIVSSGTVEWCLLQGEEVEYDLFSCSDVVGPYYANLLSEAKDVHARGFYPEAQRLRSNRVDVGNWQDGKNQELWPIGATRQPSAFSGPELKGDYGVLYRWDLQLDNSSDTPKHLEFSFNPRGGKATGTFMARREGEDWELWECKNELEAFQFYRLKSLILAPHASEKYTIYTIPEGASNYPVRLVVRLAVDEDKP